MIPTDNDIIVRALAGERSAYAELLRRHQDRAMTLAVRMLKQRTEAEEAVQDAFVRAFRALPSFERRSSFSTWLYRIVFNVCASRLERKGNEFHDSLDEVQEDERTMQLPSSDGTPESWLEGEEFSSIVRTEIDRLEPSYAAILTLFVLQEMSYDEIVETTGLPLGTVKNRLFRARMQLKSAVQRHFSQRTIAVAP